MNKKNILFSGWLVLTMLLTASMLMAADDQSSLLPVAVAPETVYDFPDTPEGEYVVHDFVIRNEGEGVLNILKVKTT